MRSTSGFAIVPGMEEQLRCRERIITVSDIGFVRRLIAEHPGTSRRALSRILCEAWNWRQCNGALRDMVCRGLMLKLHRAGHIELPEVRYATHNPLGERGSRRGRPEPALVDATPIDADLSLIRPIEFRQVRRTGEERLFNSLMDHHHYLGYTQPVGEHLKYLVYALGRPIACLAWSSAPRHPGPRDRFIGWSAEVRRKNIRFLACNTRFLILPFVRVEHLA
ncbi:MAG TPA: Druantia anti-phage system protein DruA [Acidobacteriota bacterium]|nr:Druantia anti-phage system protein DruA [Acidobacteriota bacterium]